MNNKERMELAKWASNFAIKKGATETAVSISRSRAVNIEVREQKLETIRESTDNGLSLQIYRENKFSAHSTNNLNKRQLETFISEAVEATQYLSPDPDRALPDPSLYPTDTSTDLGLVDPGHGDVTPEYRVKTAMETEQLLRQSDMEILSTAAYFSDTTAEGVRVHSNGFEGDWGSTFFSMSASLSVMDAGARPSGSFFAGQRFLNKLPKSDEIAQYALEDTMKQLGQQKIASGRYTMILDNRIAGSLLWRLFQPMSARNIQQKNSFLDGMLGKSIGSGQLTIIDDPLIKGGMASRHFDNEGIASRRRVLIENGVLNTYLIDNYYGRKLGMTPNGGSTSNIIMGYGNRNQKQILDSQQKAIFVTAFNGGNANSTTGDFSFGISGQLIENGKVVKALNEMNISGNFKNLWNQLVETGNDPYPYSSLQSPTLVFSGVDFSGI
ncbi:MAG: TldD/PmbA family protein [Bacteroidetes bacterium]|nr:MAG: TldD/PmbA family protein [Bacteroidota bacterium]